MPADRVGTAPNLRDLTPGSATAMQSGIQEERG
jgi:hypothetical protein